MTAPAWTCSEQEAKPNGKATASGEHAKPADPWNTSDAAAVFSTPLPEPRWAIPGLEFGPGRPGGLWGKPGGGKTLFVQELGLSVASGTPAFGKYECPKGKVLHISYDFGNWAVRTRYRQLANGRGLTLDDLAGQLETSVFPEIYLNTPGAESLFSQRCDGFDLVIVDCFRDAAPGVDENASDVAVYLKSMARISERQGNSFIYLHHTKKGDDETTIDSGRGSGAIAAASGTIWCIEGQGNKPRLLRHLRAHDASRGFQDPFFVELRVGGGIESFDTNGRPPLRLVAVSTEDRSRSTFFDTVEQNKAVAEKRIQMLVDFLACHPGSSKRDLRTAMKGTILKGKDDLDDAIDEATKRGLIRCGKDGNAHSYSVAESNSEAA